MIVVSKFNYSPLRFIFKSCVWIVFACILIGGTIFFTIAFLALSVCVLGSKGHPGPIIAGFKLFGEGWALLKRIPISICKSIDAHYDKYDIEDFAQEKNITVLEYVKKRTRRNIIRFLEMHKGQADVVYDFLKEKVKSDSIKKAYADLLLEYYESDVNNQQ